MLGFKANQYFIAKKYRVKIREMNSANLKVFFAMLTLMYVVQLGLHFVAAEGIIYQDHNKMAKLGIGPAARESQRDGRLT